MGLRVCLVTPFAWSRPHDVNEHVEGLARELRALGHSVTVLAPSTRASDIVAGRRALLDGVAEHEVIALGPALPVSRRSRIGVPVGVRANLALALERGRFDIVHGFEPGLPSLSYLALRDSHALGVATFLSSERLAYPPGKPQRERLLSRIDALLATSPEVAEAAAVRLPGDYSVVFPGVDAELFHPAQKRKRIVLEWRPAGRPLVRSVYRELRELPDWELVLLRTKPLSGRPTIPRASEPNRSWPARRLRGSPRTMRCASEKGGRIASERSGRRLRSSRASTTRSTASSQSDGAPPARAIPSPVEIGSFATCTCIRR